jgi:hypothetical protein
VVRAVGDRGCVRRQSMGELPPGYSVNYSAADMSSASIAQGAGQSMPADMSYVSYAQPQRVRSVSPPPVQRPPDLPAEARYVGAVQVRPARGPGPHRRATRVLAARRAGRALCPALRGGAGRRIPRLAT